MLELRPNCEICDRDTLPQARDVFICSMECTFCTDCVETLLYDVCPKCGGNLTPRPIRPRGEYRPGEGLAHNPPGTKRRRIHYTLEEIAALVMALRNVAPEQR